MNTDIKHEPVDRTHWPAGPWDDEPEDRIEWKSHGLPCLMRRNHAGAWCGYVAVPPSHPLHGSGDEPDTDVHGGITYSGLCHGDICHVPEPGEPDNVLWFGFDCGHAGDLTPYMAIAFRELYEQKPVHLDLWQYRDRDYVVAEVERLAEHLSELAG